MYVMYVPNLIKYVTGQSTTHKNQQKCPELIKKMYQAKLFLALEPFSM